MFPFVIVLFLWTAHLLKIEYHRARDLKILATSDRRPDHDDDRRDRLADAFRGRDVPNHDHCASGPHANACQDPDDKSAEGSRDVHPTCGFCNYFANTAVRSQTRRDNRNNNPIRGHTIVNGTSVHPSISTTTPDEKKGHLRNRERHRYPYQE